MRYFNKEYYFRSLDKIKSSIITSYYGKTVLITGANGLIAGSLLDFLQYLNIVENANIKIIVLVRGELQRHDFFTYEDVEVVTQSVTEPIKIQQEVDYIFHAASNAHPAAYSKFPVDTAVTTLQGTLNILNLTKEKKAKLIFVSSSEVYGELDRDVMNTESEYGSIDILSARSCYPESKRMAETLIASYIAQYDISGTIVRPAYIYGPRFNENNSRADVDFLMKALNKQNILMRSEGIQKRSYVYVLDCVNAMLIVGISGKNGEAYNVSAYSGNVQLVEFAKKIALHSNTDVEFDLQESLGGSTVKNSLLDNTALQRLNWSEKFNLDEGIIDTLTILSSEMKL